MVSQLEERTERVATELSGAPQVASLFQADTLLPFQYFELNRGDICLEGEKKLMLAVLEDAIDSFQKYYSARDKKGREIFHEAEEWIMEEKDDWFFSFTNICESLGINSDYLRRGLLKWRERQISLLDLSKGKEVRYHDEGSGLRDGSR